MNLKEILSITTQYNFHTHTQFCDGRDTMESIARAACDSGMKYLGFTPHSPIDIPSPCNMSREDVNKYMCEVDRLSRELPISIYTGMEIDFLSPSHGPAGHYYEDLGLDFCIGSVHFIPDPNGEYVDIDGSSERFARNMHSHFRDDLRYVVETFYNQSGEMLATGKFDILGHFDKVAQNASVFETDLEQQGWYNDLIDDYIKQIVSSDVIVEINTKARESSGRFFPHERYWRSLIDSGVTLAVNSDAHYFSRITAGRAEAFEILKTLGYEVG